MPDRSGQAGSAPRPGSSAAGDTGCHILHVDMDAFYASVEVRDRPELAGQPVVVGGAGARSVVLSATYPARAYGVRSAMPVSQARRLCPQALFIPPRRELYAQVSREVMAIFRAVTPEVEPLALDEAFLDVSGALRRLGRPAEIGSMIRTEVSQQQGITCSVGVATTKFVAKLASVHCKPDGLLVIPADSVLEFLHPLPVSALWGVGGKTAQALRRLGLRTVADLARAPLETLRRDLGAGAAEHLAALSLGRDDRGVTPVVAEKSIGAEETFAADIDDPEVVRRELLRLSARTARGLRAAGCSARTVVVKLRLASFRTITRSRTLPGPTDVAQEIFVTACALYQAAGLDARARLRLVGVRATGLVPVAAAQTQMSLGEPSPPWRDAEQAMDRIAGRFGTDAVRPAALVPASDSAGPGGAPAGPGGAPAGPGGAPAGPAGASAGPAGAPAGGEIPAGCYVPFHSTQSRSYSGIRQGRAARASEPAPRASS